jgi:hypothetical protein
MIYSDSAMAAILLCTNLGIDGEYKPLTLKEWNGLGKTVNDMGYKIADLLKSEFTKKLPISEKQKEQIKLLTGRGFSIALKLQELENKGIYIVTQFDSDYPKYLKRKLREKMPPVLFYAGDITLAGKIGIAIVGSRDVDDAGMLFAKDLAKKATKEKLIIYSGGAKGVDSISEKAAIDEGGYVVSFIGDSLSKKIRNKDVIQNILNKRILLFSDVNPDTGFSVGRAMNRNKFIYAAAHGAFVVSSDFGKGGTWTGAVENINNSWTKLFVWSGCEKKGNKELISKGAIPYVISEQTILDTINLSPQKDIEVCRQIDMFTKEKDEITENIKEDNIIDLYDVVKESLVQSIVGEMDANEIAQKCNIQKGQMNIWLKRLVAEGKIKRNKQMYSLPS